MPVPLKLMKRHRYLLALGSSRNKCLIKAIASGGLPDITGGSNEYRASWYNGPWRQKHPEGINIGGNVFARNPKGGSEPYAAYPGDDLTVGTRGSAAFTAGAKVDFDS